MTVRQGDYRYDIFLSYRRKNEWPRFIERHFYRMLKHWLDTTRAMETSIFFDVRDIETGASWPHRLATSLAQSRTMVCLWSREYFSSKWCVNELAQMLARREALIGPDGPPNLILPVIIHDSEHLDPSLDEIQHFSLLGFANPWMNEDSPMAERLSVEIERFAQDVAVALARVPNYDPAWAGLLADEFMRLYNDEPTQDVPPSLG
jgi:hypothetical protein